MRACLLILGLAATPAVADCLPVAGTVLSCSAKAGTMGLDVCIEGAQITYRYGPVAGDPDLTLRVPVAEVEHRPWPGIGRTVWETTTFRNGDYAYEVYLSVDRAGEDNSRSGGVLVSRAGTELARVDCDPGTAQLGLWAVSDAKEAQGICWDPGALDWADCE